MKDDANLSTYMSSVKVGATGDAVQTTPLLSRLSGQITWLPERAVPFYWKAWWITYAASHGKTEREP